ncbi:MAG: DUF3035 domain-containing protein [Rhodospirillales bacterium]
MARPRVHRTAVLAFAVVAAAGLGACSSGVKETLGLEKRAAPDEFQVTTRQPLALPPNYQLRPPQPGAAPLETAVTQQARQTVFGKDSKAAAGGSTLVTAKPGDAAAVPGFQRLSPGEQALLARAGATNADPNIRILVDRDSVQLADANKTLIDNLLFWRKPQEPGVVIDASKEQQRLKDNAAAGKGPTDGDTPTIKRRSRGVFDGLLN